MQLRQLDLLEIQPTGGLQGGLNKKTTRPELQVASRDFWQDHSSNCQRIIDVDVNSSFANDEQKYEQLLDPYHNIQRLNLYRFDGSPIPVMYLAYRPPQMVPTTILHSAATTSANSGTKERLKRALEKHIEGPEAAGTWIDTQRLWCFGLGVGTMGIGGVLMYLS